MADNADKLAKELRQAEKKLRRSIDKLEVMLRNANLISDSDFQIEK